MATKRVFYSFHFDNDVMRVQLIRNIGSLEDNKPVTINEWEEVRRGKDPAIKKWIDDNMKYRQCVVVLIGEETAYRPWVQYEIEKAWNDGKGVVGIYIHNLNCANKTRRTGSGTCSQGPNPFAQFNVKGVPLSNIVKCYNPSSWNAYNEISNNLNAWVEEAIAIRQRY